jgi:adenylate cyclase
LKFLGSSPRETKSPLVAGHGLDARVKERTEGAFRAEERRGLMAAAATRTMAVLAIVIWRMIDSPLTGWAHAYQISTIAIFGVIGGLQYLIAKFDFYSVQLKYVFPVQDCALLAIVLCLRNPFLSYHLPAAMTVHSPDFVWFFLFLLQSASSLRPALVLWCAVCIVAARTAMFVWVLSQPEVFSDRDLPASTIENFVLAYRSPDFVYLGNLATEVMAILVLAGGFVVVVMRLRRLVGSFSSAERARTNLARYFSPNVVDRLSGSPDWPGRGREQTVAVLFADIVGFTQLCEREDAQRVIALLREYHNRLGTAVFDRGGTLDKYIGDGLMATFGTPEPGPGDAKSALACAIDMIDALAAWNIERASAGRRPVRVGIGLHFGPVIAGDIGNERRLEYSVIGDTVNIASRLEHLTRLLGTPLAVSDQLVRAIDPNEEEGAALLARLSAAGEQDIRGRKGAVSVWVLRDGPYPAAPSPLDAGLR